MKNPTDNKCPDCGAESENRTEYASGFRERFVCGSVNHSDGFEKGFACVVPGAAPEAPAPAPAGLLGDMTALALTAGIRGMTVEGVHQRVSEICKRHGVKHLGPMRDRIKAADFVHRMMSAIASAGRPEIVDDAIDATLDTLLEDIRNRLNITICEMRENA